MRYPSDTVPCPRDSLEHPEETLFAFGTNPRSEFQAVLDPRNSTLHLCFAQTGIPSFSERLLDEILFVQMQVANSGGFVGGTDVRHQVKYIVVRSLRNAVFSLGGDLALFIELIRTKDRRRLQQYGRKCVDVIWLNHVGYYLPVTTISCVHGSCHGGGMEAALSSDVVIAERSARFSLPEWNFGLFPGMGAFHLLRRRMPDSAARAMMLEGETWSADEMEKRGVVDLLAENGEGTAFVRRYVRRFEARFDAAMALRRALGPLTLIDRDQLIEVVDYWAFEAISRPCGSLGRLEAVCRAQERRFSSKEEREKRSSSVLVA